MIVENGVCVIVQARLGSTRLPKKALLKLDEQNLLEHVLNSLKKVNAQCFVLACDYNSYEKFLPFANNAGFLIFAGSEADVLSRFVMALDKANKFCADKNLPPVKCIVRATGDNPFLFVEAINESIDHYFVLNAPDYFTLTGLPHGSGVELINPEALLKANASSSSIYEREHVGPAIYCHKDVFNVVYQTANKKYYFPELITTVDTAEDFLRTQVALEFLHNRKILLPAPVKKIVAATKYTSDIIIFVPSIKEGNGSGHLRRSLELAKELAKDFRIQIFIQIENLPSFAIKLLADVDPKIITRVLPKKAKLVVLDNFQTDENDINVFRKVAPVIALDEGGTGRKNADYLLDIIPRLKNEYQLNQANLEDVSFIPLPNNRKNKLGKLNTRRGQGKILVTCGGEDKDGLAIPVGTVLSNFNFDITVISPHTTFSAIQKFSGKIKLLYSMPNLREELFKYDIVVTIFGFTAFEALAAGCLVILVSPTDYHYELGTQNDFTCFPKGIPTVDAFKNIFSHGIKIPKFINSKTKQKSLAKQIKYISMSKNFSCPLCEDEIFSEAEHPIVCRLHDRTISKCEKTGLYYLSFIISDEKKYNENYFFEEYKQQYGKTYIEDFPNIIKQSKRRIKIIEECYAEYFQDKEHFFAKQKNLLDIGCAYGAFLKACELTDWFAVGSDISAEAINYVKNELKLPAFTSAFPALPESFDYVRKVSFSDNGEENFQKVKFELKDASFQAITMWFVIEHFPHLDAVLKRVSNLLVDGGIFAFSTPTLSGVSGKKSAENFFINSPKDHYSIFDIESVEKVLDLYGFKIVKIISIGHHPERFKNFANVKKGGLTYKILNAISRHKKLGDSMEVYAVKRIVI